MSNERLDKFKKLLEITTEGLTREEFLTSFKTVVDQILKLETKLIEKINQAINDLTDNQNALKNVTQVDLKGLATRFEQSINSALREQENGLNFIRDKVRKIKEGKDGQDGQPGRDGRDGQTGKDADEGKIIKEVLNKIKEFNLEIEDIKGLKETLERLETVRRMGGVGGFSYIAMQQHIVDDETPAGTLNGVNTDFTILSVPNPTNSLKVYRNGQRLKLTEDYTVSKNTITFLIAPNVGEILTCDYKK